MKKLLGIMAAGLLLFGLAGQSMAAFSTLDLVRTIYDPSATATTEVGSDLGAYALTSAGAYGTNVFVGDLIAKSLFSDPASTLVISYYSLNGATSDWATGAITDTAQAMKGRAGTNLNNFTNGTLPYYAGLTTITGTTASVLAAKGYTSGPQGSYYYFGEANGTGIGSFANTLSSSGGSQYDATISLAALAATGYVDTTLWYFNYNSSNGTVNGVDVATIRTFLTNDGHTMDLSGQYIATEINPAAVPIPPALLLLGSGLLGLIGVRRRSA